VREIETAFDGQFGGRELVLHRHPQKIAGDKLKRDLDVEREGAEILVRPGDRAIAGRGPDDRLRQRLEVKAARQALGDARTLDPPTHRRCDRVGLVVEPRPDEPEVGAQAADLLRLADEDSIETAGDIAGSVVGVL